MNKICVITPFLNKEIKEGFQIEEMSSGPLYSQGSNASISLVSTKMGSTFVGDAVLSLAEEPYKYLVFFGACGAVREDKHLAIGSLLSVAAAQAQDSFINVLQRRPVSDTFPADLDFSSLPKVNCLSIGSLRLEKQYLETLPDNIIDVVDMETAAFFAAARAIRKKAGAILFVSDILDETSFYAVNKPQLKKITREAAVKTLECTKTLIS